MIKYGRYGKPHLKFVRVVSDALYWTDVLSSGQTAPLDQTKLIPLSDIVAIRSGKATDVLKRSVAKAAPERCCFSVVAATRTFDAQVKTEQERDEWVIHLRSVVGLAPSPVKANRLPVVPSPAALEIGHSLDEEDKEEAMKDGDLFEVDENEGGGVHSAAPINVRSEEETKEVVRRERVAEKKEKEKPRPDPIPIEDKPASSVRITNRDRDEDTGTDRRRSAKDISTPNMTADNSVDLKVEGDDARRREASSPGSINGVFDVEVAAKAREEPERTERSSEAAHSRHHRDRNEAVTAGDYSPKSKRDDGGSVKPDKTGSSTKSLGTSSPVVVSIMPHSPPRESHSPSPHLSRSGPLSRNDLDGERARERPSGREDDGRRGDFHTLEEKEGKELFRDEEEEEKLNMNDIDEALALSPPSSIGHSSRPPSSPKRSLSLQPASPSPRTSTHNYQPASTNAKRNSTQKLRKTVESELALSLMESVDRLSATFRQKLDERAAARTAKMRLLYQMAKHH